MVWHTISYYIIYFNQHPKNIARNTVHINDSYFQFEYDHNMKYKYFHNHRNVSRILFYYVIYFQPTSKNIARLGVQINDSYFWLMTIIKWSTNILTIIETSPESNFCKKHPTHHNTSHMAYICWCANYQAHSAALFDKKSQTNSFESTLGNIFKKWNLSACTTGIKVCYSIDTTTSGGRLNISMFYQNRNRLIFNMEIPIPGKDSLYIETGSWWLGDPRKGNINNHDVDSEVCSE